MQPSKRLTELFAETSTQIAGYLRDSQVNEILVNPDGKVWVDTFTAGRACTEIQLSADVRKRIICLVAGMSNKIVNYSNPDLAIEVANTGERFQGMLPPLVVAPAFSIRKHCPTVLTLDDYVKDAVMSARQAAVIKEYVAKRKNIIACGATASGKTTLGNAILHEIAKHNQRVIILEDTRELQCSAKDVVQLKTSTNRSMRDLVKISLRLRPDRIIVGEVRGGEALELLKAWSTGHPGGLATLHADSAQDCLFRLEDLVQESISSRQQRLIASSIDVIIYIERANNHRTVKEIIEVNNLKQEETHYDLVNIK